MTEVMVIQGRELHAEDIGLIRSLLAEHGDWRRTRISEELCRRWDWRNGQGRFKDMAARTLLLKLERAGLIQLPKQRRPSSNGLKQPQPTPCGSCNRVNPLRVARSTASNREHRRARIGRPAVVQLPIFAAITISAIATR